MSQVPAAAQRVALGALTLRQSRLKLHADHTLPEWRNWQTRWTQNPVPVKGVRVRVPPLAPYRKDLRREALSPFSLSGSDWGQIGDRVAFALDLCRWFFPQPMGRIATWHPRTTRQHVSHRVPLRRAEVQPIATHARTESRRRLPRAAGRQLSPSGTRRARASGRSRHRDLSSIGRSRPSNARTPTQHSHAWAVCWTAYSTASLREAWKRRHSPACGSMSAA